MIFLSFWFVAFALAFLPAFWLVRYPGPRLILLAVGCVIFHGHFAGPAGVIPIVVLGVLTYLCGLSRRPLLCAFGMAASITALVFYKYTLFLATSLIDLSPDASAYLVASSKTVLPAMPPLAISFFVFEFVHYLFDVLHGSPPIRNPLHFGLFAIFWPSLVAGPIKRYQQFIPALTKGVATVAGEDAVLGGLRVVGGMSKKVVADNLTLWIDAHAPRFETLDLPSRWLFLAFLALRIYLDFSGYSDMAIGYARMMGVHLPENFNWPYFARSIDDFWRRWHISLSSWIRDYVYIPLGGSRHGIVRKLSNGMVAFAICGLWHGAAWNFIYWGVYHGAGLAFSASYARIPIIGPAVTRGLAFVPGLRWALTLLFVAFGWLLFFYPTERAWQMAILLFTPLGG
ncbi:MAG: MBOAT family protein [Chloroflexi bacterium]|nr:MBOAT family protein [Chloroflexota bacterium]